MDGIGSQKAIQIRSRLGISGKIKIKELTKSRIEGSPLHGQRTHTNARTYRKQNRK
ncbi:hypothetical protein MKW92_020398 [Papaver armeniacum]|nr:hypothetical protein MKW92_020398 [Papaver armeniacum]